MFVIARTVVRFSAPGGGLQFVGETGRPLFPGEVPLLGELDREREGLRLPRLGEHWPAVVTRQPRKVEERLAVPHDDGQTTLLFRRPSTKA